MMDFEGINILDTSITLRVTEDSAGNKYYAAFVPELTAPIKLWVEKPKLAQPPVPGGRPKQKWIYGENYYY